MKIPTLTHLQFAVLESLLDGDLAGFKVRESLAKKGDTRSGPAFYQLMARIEEEGLVKGRYEYSTVDNQPIKERWYKLTAVGRRAWEATAEFYAGAVAALQGGTANA